MTGHSSYGLNMLKIEAMIMSVAWFLRINTYVVDLLICARCLPFSWSTYFSTAENGHHGPWCIMVLNDKFTTETVIFWFCPTWSYRPWTATCNEKEESMNIHEIRLINTL